MSEGWGDPETALTARGPGNGAEEGEQRSLVSGAACPACLRGRLSRQPPWFTLLALPARPTRSVRLVTDRSRVRFSGP